MLGARVAETISGADIMSVQTGHMIASDPTHTLLYLQARGRPHMRTLPGRAFASVYCTSEAYIAPEENVLVPVPVQEFPIEVEPLNVIVSPTSCVQVVDAFEPPE